MVCPDVGSDGGVGVCGVWTAFWLVSICCVMGRMMDCVEKVFGGEKIAMVMEEK